MTRLRWTSVAAIAASGLILGALAFACGTDDGVSPPACSGVDCDGGSVDATLADGGADANVTDAGSDGVGTAFDDRFAPADEALIRLES